MAVRLALALLVLLAGCTTIGGGGPAARTPTSDTSVPTSTPTPTTNPMTPDAPAGATDANTIAYAELSTREKRAFDAAVAGEAKFFSGTSYLEGDYFDPDLAEPFEVHEFVRRNGSYYRLSDRPGAVVASYDIEATSAEPSAEASVVAYGNLSSGSQDAVRWAIENGSYATPWGKWNSLPEDLSGVDSVRYAGETYRTRIVVGDAWVRVVSAEPVG